MIDLIIPARRRDLGGGMEVGRVLPFAQRRMVGPFIFFDHIGPVDLPVPIPRTQDVRPHPHIGLSTVTYLFNGEMTHRDSLGFEQVIRPTEVNWMTAGRGISHSERFDGMRTGGGLLHGIQAWVALPDSAEENAPAFEHYSPKDMALIEDGSRRARVIAGEAFGAHSKVKTHSPLFYVHLELQPGATIDVPNHCPERAIYIAQGLISVGGREYQPGQMLVLPAHTSPTITAVLPAIVMLLGGEPVGPRHIWWNFVSSRKERIEQAKADWSAGRIDLPLNDNGEFIPLPDQ